MNLKLVFGFRHIYKYMYEQQQQHITTNNHAQSTTTSHFSYMSYYCAKLLIDLMKNTLTLSNIE